jgi:hypothetical protein
MKTKNLKNIGIRGQIRSQIKQEINSLARVILQDYSASLDLIQPDYEKMLEDEKNGIFPQTEEEKDKIIQTKLKHDKLTALIEGVVTYNSLLQNYLTNPNF